MRVRPVADQYDPGGAGCSPPVPLPGSEVGADVEPYLRADGTKVRSLMQLERQLRPQAFCRRWDGYMNRRRTMGHREQPAVRP